jgi:hypothetical protein
MGAVAVRKANYGSFVFTLPLELPSSSYYQAEVRCSDAGDVVGMSPVFSVAHDQQVRATAADTAGFTTFVPACIMFIMLRYEIQQCASADNNRVAVRQHARQLHAKVGVTLV